MIVCVVVVVVCECIDVAALAVVVVLTRCCTDCSFLAAVVKVCLFCILVSDALYFVGLGVLIDNAVVLLLYLDVLLNFRLL